MTLKLVAANPEGQKEFFQGMEDTLVELVAVDCILNNFDMENSLDIFIQKILDVISEDYFYLFPQRKELDLQGLSFTDSVFSLLNPVDEGEPQRHKKDPRNHHLYEQFIRYILQRIDIFYERVRESVKRNESTSFLHSR